MARWRCEDCASRFKSFDELFQHMKDEHKTFVSPATTPEVDDPCWRILHAEVQDYLEYVRSGDYNCDEAKKYKHAIYETAIEAVYGKAVWEEINAYIEEAER